MSNLGNFCNAISTYDKSYHAHNGQKCIGRESNPGLAESSEV
jgi:hypothetical protein